MFGKTEINFINNDAYSHSPELGLIIDYASYLFVALTVFFFLPVVIGSVTISMTPPVRLLVGRLAYHYLLKGGKLHFQAPIGALVYA